MNTSTGREAAGSADEIRAHLSELLKSAQFRSSRRCQDLLKFVVENAIEGRLDVLKERVIGIEVFNRSSDYSPAEDPVVRITAADVRKRLAHYYQENPASTPRSLRIRIPAGHYVPEFCGPEASKPERAPKVRVRRRVWVWAVPVLILAPLLVAWHLWNPRNALERFWEPVFQSRHTPLVLMERYGPAALMSRLNAELGKTGAGISDSGNLVADDIAATFYQAVMLGNVYALRGLDRVFFSKGIRAELRVGVELSTTELAERPVILVGYFNNPWAKSLRNEKPRFTLSAERAATGYIHAIRDNLNPGRSWTIASDRPWFEDSGASYAIVTRLYDPRSKRFLLSLAGMTHPGTHAAGDFITGRSYLEELQRQAPPGWEKKNVQIVLSTSIVNRTPTPPKMVASHFW